MKRKWKKWAGIILAASVSLTAFPIGTIVSFAAGEESVSEAEIGNAVFEGEFEYRPDTVNLTKQGNLDWVRLDSEQFGNFNRKNVSDSGITNLCLIGSSGDLTRNAETNFVYTDGMSPEESEEACRDSLIFTGTGNGFEFTVPGGSETKCLDIYMGAWAAEATVTADVNGQEVWNASFEGTDTTPGSQAEYQTLRLDYSTEETSDVVTITVLVTKVYDTAWGNMNVGAVTLGTGRVEDDGSVIGGAAKTAPGSADLTAEGILDWVYLNQTSFSSINKKNIEEHAISGLEMADPSMNMTMSEKTKTSFFYTDGISPEEETDVHKAAVFTGAGNGLQFELPGSTETRYLNIYTGAWAADLRAEVLVNDSLQYSVSYGSEDTTPDTTDYRVIKLQYRTKFPEDKVKIRITVDNVYDTSWGNINISAITFSDIKPVNVEETIKTDTWEIDHTGGQLQSLRAKIGGEMYDIPVRTDQYGGFSWYWNGQKVLMSSTEKADGGKIVYSGNVRREGQDLTFTLSYDVTEAGQMEISASVKNNTNETVAVDEAALSMGFNTYMEKYPDYNKQFFPTLIRCEKTHAWGYFSTPEGRLLTFVTDSPVASYTMEYQNGQHRIYSVSLDLLKAGKLPDRHPQNMDQLAAGEEKSWRIYWKPVDTLHGLDEVKQTITENSDVVIFDSEQYTLGENEETQIVVYSDTEVKEVQVDKLAQANVPNVRTKDGESDTEATAYIEQAPLTDPISAGGKYIFSFRPESGAGMYRLRADNGSYQAEAIISERNTWKWYMERAKQAAVEHPAKAADCCESWYGLYSGFIGQYYFPDEAQDEAINEQFENIYSVIGYDENGIPQNNASRIQNHSTTIGILTDKYRASQNIEDLEKAVKTADWLIDEKQDENGAYIGPTGDYTSVIYPAKSIMELMYEEKRLAESDREDQAVWQERYDRHFESVKKAMDNLVRLNGDLHTEGQITLEDGAVACSATQLSEFALMYPEGSQERQTYTEAAKLYLDYHEALEQRLIPDSRMNGGSLRFWEAQYDTLVTANPNNMMNSPHGWTAWTIYALFNMYELTGDQGYLQRGMNTMGTCVQLMGFDGNLYWAFISDPQIEASLTVQKPGDTSEYGEKTSRQVTLGETYVDMITDWWKTPAGQNVGGYYGQGGSCDNDVHEIFKAMEETVLTKAYVTETGDGVYETYNCSAVETDGVLTVTANENEITDEIIFNMQRDGVYAEITYSDGKTAETVLDSGISSVKEKFVGEVSTNILEYALSLAETADTEGVIDSVMNNFNNARAVAEDVLARAQAGDPSLTQEMVDENWQNLIKTMQYLSFKQGDKTDLQKVIDMAKSLDLNEYLDEGRQAFTDALAAAEAVLADGDAMQDEVDQSWRDLLKAMSELRLKPNKDALKDLIDEADGMSTEDADEETITVFQNALAAAMSVYDNEQATEEEVMTAEEGLQAALDQLRAAVGDTEEPDNSGGDGNTGSGGGAQDQSGEDDQNSQEQNGQIVGSTGGSSADASDKDSAPAQTDMVKNSSAQKSVKTGDTAAPIAGMASMMMLAAATGIITYRKRRETR